MSPDADLDRAGLLALATALAREAGLMVQARRHAHGIEHASSKSSATDLVTEHDRAAERLIVGRLLDARPDDGVVGEEGAAIEGTSGVRWLVDPIDGTTNFVYGLAGYNVSIAAATETGTQVGAVYVPALDELFGAMRGGGATCNDVPIRASGTTVLAEALVATGFSYLVERRTAQAAQVARMIGQVRDIRRSGAAAYDLCCAAAGRVDVYFERHLGPWDLAAGELIATEAGCRTGSFDGGPVQPSNVLVATAALFEPMVALLAATADSSRETT
jgi:myo-inositol-1(or 4)-monophosphatase